MSTDTVAAIEMILWVTILFGIVGFTLGMASIAFIDIVRDCWRKR